MITIKVGDTHEIKITTGNGAPGLSTYEIAVNLGFIGTKEEWLGSMKGDKFKYSDFTTEQLESLSFKYSDFTPEQLETLSFKYADFTPEQLALLKGEQGKAFTYADFTPEQLELLKGATGKSAYQSAVDDGYSGTEAEFAQNQVDILNNNVRLVAVENKLPLKADLLDDLVPQSQIDPMQGQYTGISGKITDYKNPYMINKVSKRYTISVFFDSSTNDIITGHYLIRGTEFIDNRTGALWVRHYAKNNTTVEVWDGGRKKLYTVTRKGLLTVTAESNLIVVYFNDEEVARWDGVVILEPMMLFYEPQPITYNCRVFNCVLTLEQVKSLWNGGRWWEKSIGEEHRRNLQDMEWWTTLNNTDTGIISETITSTYRDLTMISIDESFPRIQSTAPKETNNTFITIEIDAECVDGYLMETFVGLNNANAINITTRGIYTIVGRVILTMSGTIGVFPVMSNIGKTVRVYSYTLRFHSLQEEFLPSSLCKNGVWKNTAGGNDLIGSDSDIRTYHTGPLSQQVLWGENAPTFAPDFIGQEYYDTLNLVKYSGFGTVTANDWK